jgi:hypothetical protein
MAWTLYAQWRFRGISPADAWGGPSSGAWPSRVAAVEQAFAIHAAELERTTLDVIEGFASSFGNG